MFLFIGVLLKGFRILSPRLAQALTGDSYYVIFLSKEVSRTSLSHYIRRQILLLLDKYIKILYSTRTIWLAVYVQRKHSCLVHFNCI